MDKEQIENILERTCTSIKKMDYPFSDEPLKTYRFTDKPVHSIKYGTTVFRFGLALAWINNEFVYLAGNASDDSDGYAKIDYTKIEDFVIW